MPGVRKRARGGAGGAARGAHRRTKREICPPALWAQVVEGCVSLSSARAPFPPGRDTLPLPSP
eukprot:4484963-Pyramimonas_sp.AAC.1